MPITASTFFFFFLFSFQLGARGGEYAKSGLWLGATSRSTTIWGVFFISSWKLNAVHVGEKKGQRSNIVRDDNG